MCGSNTVHVQLRNSSSLVIGTVCFVHCVQDTIQISSNGEPCTVQYSNSRNRSRNNDFDTHYDRNCARDDDQDDDKGDFDTQYNRNRV